MEPERRQSLRYPFTASAEVLNPETSDELYLVSGDLSRFGCFLQTERPFARGTRIWIRIEHDGLTFEAWGRVAYILPGGMGVVFTTIEHEDELVLEMWLSHKIE